MFHQSATHNTPKPTTKNHDNETAKIFVFFISSAKKRRAVVSFAHGVARGVGHISPDKLACIELARCMSEEGENSKKRVQDEEPEGANSVPAKKLVADLEPVLERAVTAIRALKSHSGSSLKAIQKQLSSSKEEAALLKDALKLGVQQKKITQNKMSFLVTGENYPDPTPRIEVLETVAAADANAQKCKDGEAVTVSYVGTLAESGVEFDKGEAYFVLGEGEVIAGLEQGTRGMAVGEKRKLKIPPSLGYGKRASGAVPANSVLLFEVELKSIGGEPPQALEEEEEEEEVEEEGSGDYAGEGGSDE